MINLNLIKNIPLILEKRTYFLVLSIIFRIALEFSYKWFVSPLFEDDGFSLVAISFKYIESWIIYLVLILVFPTKLNRVSDYLLAYLLFALLTPILVFYCLADAERSYLYLVLLQVSIILFFRSGDPIKLPFVKNGALAVYLLVIAGSVFVTTWMIGTGGVSFFNLDLNKVYFYRRNVEEVINAGFITYLNIWATKVFGPTLLALSLSRKKYFIALTVLVLHVVWFGISSHKSVLFYPFLVIFLWAWFQDSRSLALIPLALTVIVCASFLIFVFSEDDLIGSLLIRRVFFVPAYLTFTYYEFFSQNPFVLWSQTITSWFLDYPYSQGPAEEIGTYLGTDAHADNSFISTGFMHAGVFGVVLYGVLAGYLFRFIDSLSNKGVPTWLAVATIIVPSVSLIMSADLPTALLTHGFGIAIAILFLLRSPTRESAQFGVNP